MKSRLGWLIEVNLLLIVFFSLFIQGAIAEVDWYPIGIWIMVVFCISLVGWERGYIEKPRWLGLEPLLILWVIVAVASWITSSAARQFARRPHRCRINCKNHFLRRGPGRRTAGFDTLEMQQRTVTFDDPLLDKACFLKLPVDIGCEHEATLRHLLRPAEQPGKTFVRRGPPV